MHTVPADAASSSCVATSAKSSSTTSCPEVTSAPKALDAASATTRALSSCHCRQWHEERARVVALAASNALGAEVTSGQEVVEELLAEVATQEEEAASAGTVCIVPPGFVTAQRPSSPIL